MSLSRRRLIGSVGVATTAVLAGCTGSSENGESSDGPTVEVVENEFEGDLELSDHEVENGQVLGTDAIVATGTVTNTSDEPIEATIGAKFYDSDDVLLGEDEPSEYSGTEIASDESREYKQAIEGDAADVARVELRVLEVESAV